MEISDRGRQLLHVCCADSLDDRNVALIPYRDGQGEESTRELPCLLSSGIRSVRGGTLNWQKICMTGGKIRDLD
jgi:hypothetical protein